MNEMNETNAIRMQRLKEICENENTRNLKINKMEAYTIVYTMTALPVSERTNIYTNLQMLYSLRNNLFTDFMYQNLNTEHVEDIIKRYNKLVKFISFVFRYLENLNDKKYFEIYDKFDYVGTEEYSNKILNTYLYVKTI